MSYEIICPPFTLKFDEMSKKELREYFDWYVKITPVRMTVLSGFVKDDPDFKEWTPDLTPSSLDDLGQWLCRNVDQEKRTKEDIENIKSQLKFPIEFPETDLTIKSYSICIDVGMYICQVFLKNNQSLQLLQEFGSKNYIDYGKPVVGNFGIKRFEPIRMITVLAYGILDGEKTGDDLRKLYNIWERMATKQ